jgi:hypothetical protein
MHGRGPAAYGDAPFWTEVDMADDDFPGDEGFDDEFAEADFGGHEFSEHDHGPLPDEESWQVSQDLDDLDAFEQVFAGEGVKGVSMFCHDCDEEHFYRWELLRNSLELLLETGEIPVHEPAFQPNPDDYVPWEYARGYVDALRDAGVDQRTSVDHCPRCGLHLTDTLASANWCPRCAAPLLAARLRIALGDIGIGTAATNRVLRSIGLPEL